MGVEHVGRIIVLNDTQSNVEAGIGDITEIIIGIDNVNDKLGFSSDSGSTWVWVETGTDSNAIHDNVGGEINAITEKVTTVDGDVILIEDSEDTYSKKKILISSLLIPESSEIILDDDDPRNFLYDDDGDLIYE